MVDLGDGAFKEKRECKDQEDLCTFQVGKWQAKRTEKNSGNSVSDQLTWPSVRLSKTGTCDGCERQGDRKAEYTVRFKDTNSGSEKPCTYSDVSKWKSFKVGSAWKGKVGSVFGGIECGSLVAE